MIIDEIITSIARWAGGLLHFWAELWIFEKLESNNHRNTEHSHFSTDSTMRMPSHIRDVFSSHATLRSALEEGSNLQKGAHDKAVHKLLKEYEGLGPNLPKKDFLPQVKRVLNHIFHPDKMASGTDNYASTINKAVRHLEKLTSHQEQEYQTFVANNTEKLQEILEKAAKTPVNEVERTIKATAFTNSIRTYGKGEGRAEPHNKTSSKTANKGKGVFIQNAKLETALVIGAVVAGVVLNRIANRREQREEEEKNANNTNTVQKPDYTINSAQYRPQQPQQTQYSSTAAP